MIWAYAGRQAGPLPVVVQTVTEGKASPEAFMFSDDEDRRKFRRRIEDAMRKTASDWDLILIADILKVRV